MKTTPKLKPVKAFAVWYIPHDSLGVATYSYHGHAHYEIFPSRRDAENWCREETTSKITPVLITPIPAKRKPTKPRTPKTKK